MSKFNELVSKLREVFQIDRPELDFGVYRILNARADEINEYLEKRLKEKVEQALATGSAANVDQLKDDLKKAEQAATDAGFDPAESPKVKELQAKITQANSGNAEHENAVFSHLLTFFSRYYDNGDFISQRRYKGDTYAIPYAGEEVMLHWANKDQYYIKSGENFSNYSFKLEDGRVVHFRLVAADTAKDNRKDNDKERRFVLAEQKIINRTDDDGEEYEDEILPVEEVTKTDTAGNEHKELIIRFEYKSMPKGSKQDKLISEAVVRVLTKSLVANRWLDLSKRAPTEKNPKRTLLEKHLTHYTAKNTADYFIHKNLGKFLRGELDFYIKNEVMHLDDVQNAEAFTDIEKNLRMIQCLRSIALDLIRFLAQLEDFQKRLWSKKKFVVAAEYCISVDLIPERLFSDVIKCESQWTEWKSLGFISDIPVVGDRKKELFENKSLTIDTALFGDKFKRDWLLSVGNLDDLTMGWLINSDNYQALNTIEKKYINAIDGIYVDPPYNTDSAEILYKNGYKDSTWCSLISGRLEKSRDFLKQDSMLCITIDEHEVSNLDLLLKETFPGYKVRPIIIEYNHRGRVKNNFAITHEYGLWAIPDGKDLVTRQAEISDEIKRNLRRTGSGSTRAESESQFYGIEVDNESLEIVNVTEALEGLHVQVPINKKSNTTVVWPIDDQGIERRWYYGRDRVIKEAKEGTVWAKKIKGEIQIHYRQPGKPKMRKSVWTGPKLDASTHGSELLNDLFNVTQINFSFPKSLYAVRDCLESLTSNKNAHFLDYFAGSGTTGHAVINMNLKDNGKRKFTLIEQGQYFSSVTLPRIRKALFSDTWKYGKAREGSGLPGVIIKYIRLESYEDALNNLELKRPKIELFDNNPELKEDYLLNYMLDIESRGSLLSTDDFKKPFDYTMKIAVDSAGAFEEQKIDLVETFNYLIGLTVKSYEYEIEKGYVRVEGTLPTGENTLVLWRDCEKIDHEKLIAWENRLNIGGKDNPYDVIYINGDHNIASIYAQTKDEGGETWVRAIRQIEPEFLARMFDEEEV